MLWIALTILLVFSDNPVCRVQGTLSITPGDAPTFDRTDGCKRFISDRFEERALVLRSEKYEVTIAMPASGGNQAFAYNWGSEIAWIRGQVWTAVSYRRIIKA